MSDIRAILDLDRYPLDRPARCGGLVGACRAALDRDGLFDLPGFVRAEAIARAAAELAPLVREASFHHVRSHNIYFLDRVEGVPDDHPALTRSLTSNRTVCADRITDNPIHAVYEWPPLADFLARVLGKPRLYRMEDPLARVNVMGYREDEGLGWHFDRSEFTTTLLVQASRSGGEFQYRLDLRSDADPNLDGIARLFEGRDPEVKTLRPAPGTLNVFKGRNTAHRVTPVRGPRERLSAVFSYYERPGVAFGKEERLGFYGRAE